MRRSTFILTLFVVLALTNVSFARDSADEYSNGDGAPLFIAAIESVTAETDPVCWSDDCWSLSAAMRIIEDITRLPIGASLSPENDAAIVHELVLKVRQKHPRRGVPYVDPLEDVLHLAEGWFFIEVTDDILDSLNGLPGASERHEYLLAASLTIGHANVRASDLPATGEVRRLRESIRSRYLMILLLAGMNAAPR